jgi:molybdate transport system ATP-binding protein
MLYAALHATLAGGFVLDVEFTADAGVTILFGASGSGKTTVLRAIAGLVPSLRGVVRVDDTVLFDSASGVNLPVHLRRIGYVSQSLALFPHLTVSQNIAYGLDHESPQLREQRVGEMLSAFKIEHLRNRRPAQASGGEQQRIALARSLVTRPRLLLLDEPLSALDHATQSHIMADLRAWNRQRAIPILYVTHSHREAFELGQQILVLAAGRMQAQGVPHEVLDAPARLALASIAGFENVFAAEVRSVDPSQGTMTCAIGQHTDIEVPYTGAAAGARVHVAVRAGDILIATEPPSQLSARNVLRGAVTSLGRRGPTVIARVAVGVDLDVHLTPAACERLQLAPGRAVWAVIKTYSWRVLIDTN